MNKTIALLLILVIFIYGCSSGSVDQTIGTGTSEDGSGEGAVAGGQAGPEISGDVEEIEIVGNQFVEGSIAIDAGTSVKWTNKDAGIHTVSFQDEIILDKVVKAGESAAATFNTPGAYSYKCKIHPEMTGIITVE